MKNLVAFICIVVIAYFGTQYGPWYMVALAGLVGGLIAGKPWPAFLIAFIAVSALWFIQLKMLTDASPSDLPERMGKLIGVGSGLNLMLASSAIGGLVAGCAAAAGGVLMKKKKKRRRY